MINNLPGPKVAVASGFHPARQPVRLE